MLSLIPGHASRAAQPTARLSNTSTTVRQRLFGARSTAFLVFMAVGLFASLPYCLFPSVQWEPLGRALVIFAGPPLSTAYNLRFRSIPAWLSVGWISVVAGVPVPFAIGFGFLAMVLYYLHERAIDQLDAQARVQTRTELRPLVRRLVIVKIGTALALEP